jgi:hypothetical protein
MSKDGSELGAAWWGQSIEDMDREVARLASLCRVRVLDPGVIDRVLQNDASVCGTSNPAAFTKLRTALMMHYHLRDKAVGAIGEAQTSVLVKQVVERLRKRFGDSLGGEASQ